MKIIIHDIEHIDKIVEHLHDRFFWLDKISFSDTDKTLKIPTSILSEETIVKKRLIFSKRKVDILPAELLVRNVRDYKLVDEAGIRVGDINRIFLKDETTLCIKCGLPAHIDIHVSEISLELNASDQVLESVEYITYPFSVTKLNPKEFSIKQNLRS